MEYRLTSIHDHPRGKVYEIQVNGKLVSVLLTYHVLKDSHSGVLPTISFYGRCFPRRGARRSSWPVYCPSPQRGDHLVRVIYEYEETLPVAVTVYSPSVERYFRGGGDYEDRLLS